MQTGTATVEDNMEFPEKLKRELPFDPAIPLLGIYPKNPKTPIQKNFWRLMFIAALFTIAKCQKQPKCPSVDEWIKKLWTKNVGGWRWGVDRAGESNGGEMGTTVIQQQ